MLCILFFIPYIFAPFNAESKITIKIARPVGTHGIISDEYWAQPARFGVPDYNGDREDDELVDLRSLEPDNNLACNEIHVDLTEKIVLIDRTECYFIVKVQNAQAQGAAAVIIISDTSQTPIMAPIKGFNHSEIYIPAVLVSNLDGAHIRELIAENHENQPNHKPTATIRWDVPEQTGVVGFELFTTVNDMESQMFKENFGRIAKTLVNSKQLDFSVRYVIYSGESGDMGQDCTQYDDGTAERPCQHQCISHGRYCSMDPDLTLVNGVHISGEDDMFEEVREMCLFNYTKFEEIDGIDEIDIWFNYVAEFGDQCLRMEMDTDLQSEEDCAKRVIEKVEQNFGLPKDKIWSYIETCMHNGNFTEADGTLRVEADEPNTILDWEIEYRKHWAGVWLSPSYTINGYEMRGSWHCPENANADNCNIFKAICAAYQDGLKPSLCFNGWGCAAGKYRDECDKCVLEAPLEDLDKECDPNSREYPSAAPTALTAIIIEEEAEGVSKGQAVLLIIIGAVLSGIGLGGLCVFYVFKRNERFAFEAARTGDGYIQDVPDGADSGMVVASNGLIEDDGTP